MCFFGGGSPEPTPMNQPPPIMGRNPDLVQASRRPEKKKIVDEEEVVGVEYGATQKKSGSAAGKKTGTGALRIPLNTGTTAGQSTGGVNTGGP